MPRRERRLADIVRAAEGILRRRGIDHVFVGAISVIVFGEPRTTRDVDVVARLTTETVEGLAADFRRAGFLASEEDLRDAMREGGHSSLEDTRSPLRIDLLVASTPADDHALRHRLFVRWAGLEFPVASPEHTVVMKIRFGSPQDLEDAFSILTERWEKLDVSEMEAFARQQGVLERLRALTKKAAPGGRPVE